ncbi:ankyrin repeat domain-containing protein [Stenotrophomonas pigmentata]|uniref:ankyrin repeat domain-containing protein n=1 Tax=Stenotrophomonas pigmentata TaxID=3055080 RepID=UPI0026F33A00|nr:ankyrin repeat domain-containing protein [Stenotrophomonas sp. 610A2]
MAKTKQERANQKLRDAIEFYNYDAFLVAIERGADVNVLDEDGYPPLHTAVYLQQQKMVKVLIARGADVNLSGQDGWTPLHEAARGGNTESVQMLLDAGASLASFCTGHYDPIGGYPIHEASGAAVSLLVEHGADVEAKDEMGRTPLHYRANGGDAVGVRSLLSLGANPYPLDNEGKSPLEYLDPNSKKYKGVLEALAPSAAERDRLTLDASTVQSMKSEGPIGKCERCGRPAHTGRCRF